MLLVAPSTYMVSRFLLPGSLLLILACPTLRAQEIDRSTFDFGRPLDQQRAYIIFSFIRAQPDLDFGTPHLNRCHARCQLVVERLIELGLTPRRGWCFANGASLFVKHEKAPRGTIEWDYHVAPMLEVRVGDKLEWLIFDPALFDRPVTLERWGAAMRKDEKARPPELTTTAIGEAPIRGGKRTPGTGYWPMPDPPGGAAAYARKLLRPVAEKTPK